MAPRPDRPAASAVGRTPARPGDWYAGLDLLRIAAALLVLGFHVVTLCATLGLSALGWWLVERPANRWLRQRIARRDGAA